MELNQYQTPIEELVYKKMDPLTGEVSMIRFKDAPEEVQNEFNEAVATVPLIQWLISADRPKIGDLPRDENGRAIWRIEYPPIIEDTDYFRPTALHFQKTGLLTDLRPNPNPNSEYAKWKDEEVRRIREGFLRESDGAYIPGYMYWYLNYCPIVLTLESEENEDVGDRIEEFPNVWEGLIWRFTGWQKARSLGKYFFEVSKRGSSKSYSIASGLSRGFVIGDRKPSPNHKAVTRGVVLADNKDFLIRDGTLNKFESMIDFQAENTQFPRKRLKNSLNDMSWTMGYIDLNTGTKKGTGNEVYGVAIKDDPGKVRGKRASLYALEEIGKFPNLAAVMKTAERSVKDGNVVFGLMIGVGCVCAGTKVYTKEGIEINIEDLKPENGILGFNIETEETSLEDITYVQEPVYKECVRITAARGITLECSVDHPILTRITHAPRAISYKEGNKRDFQYELKFVKAGDLKPENRQALVLSRGKIGTFGTYELEDPYLIGLLIGDGSYGYDKTPRLSNCDEDVLSYVKERYKTKIERGHITKDGKSYEELRIKGICSMLRSVGIYGQVKADKRLPTQYKELSEHSASLLLAGLYDTDGCITPDGKLELCSSSEVMLRQVQELLLKFGIYSHMRKMKANISPTRKDKNDWFCLKISESSSSRKFKEYIPLKIKYKQEALKRVLLKKSHAMMENMSVALIKKVEHIGIQRVYNLTANNTHTYLANNIITHNTGGEEGNDFSGALDLIYHPTGSNILAFENVWDKSSQARGTSIFCFPAYVNRLGCYNKDGISDVTKALYQICWERYIAKYENPDPMQITRTKAEDPITLQDAIMRRDGTKFPVAQITERIQEIDLNPNFFDCVEVGRLVQESSGNVRFEPTADKPIHKFPHKDNKIHGAVEIRVLPERNRDGKVFSGRYIAGCDPIDDDTSTTLSLVSIYVLDLWTDNLVCEWTGRLDDADSCYEICRLMCIFYNAKLNYENNKKGLYAYFKKMNCLYLLAETLEFLKDKEWVSGDLRGNKMYGVNANEHINGYARDRLKDWLLLPVKVVEKTPEGEKETTVPKVMTLWNRALLEECRQWNPDGNFDRVSAMGMLMLMREEKMIIAGGTITPDRGQSSKKDKGQDPFFERNYKPGKHHGIQ